MRLISPGLEGVSKKIAKERLLGLLTVGNEDVSQKPTAVIC